MLLVVGALAVRLVTFRDSLLVDAVVVLLLLVLGYTLPVLLLLGRASRYPPPPDAAYVRSTLVIPADVKGHETPFEWRNQGYAQRFLQANWEHAIGEVTRVDDHMPAHQL
jgi:hypothetical protein